MLQAVKGIQALSHQVGLYQLQEAVQVDVLDNTLGVRVLVCYAAQYAEYQRVLGVVAQQFHGVLQLGRIDPKEPQWGGSLRALAACQGADVIGGHCRRRRGEC